MNESFADRMRAEETSATSDLPEGARVAVALRARLTAAGLICDDVFADEDGWCFFVSTQQAPVGVMVTRGCADRVPTWQASAQYEGGLSSIWSEQHARHGIQLALRIQALLDEYLAERAPYTDGGDSAPRT